MPSVHGPGSVIVLRFPSDSYHPSVSLLLVLGQIKERIAGTHENVAVSKSWLEYHWLFK
jgi:hypothetical protein